MITQPKTTTTHNLTNIVYMYIL